MTALPQMTSLEQLLLAEYQILKEEQRARIGFRDNLLYVTLAVLAGIITAAAHSGETAMLLALPPVCLALGWTYLVNDEKITAIGGYVRDQLGPRLVALCGGNGPAAAVFGWETAHRADARRRSRKVIQCGIDVMTFVLIPLAALVAHGVSGESSAPLLALAGVEALLLLGLACQFVVYALAARAGPVSPAAGAGGR